ncbi:MAG: sugar ABC transporter permease [Candidatus Neomarinimicrobiota bacterium]|nr:sugar ABC transporter permease [Candidatus Neomarinimicrobiota bacterium]MCD6101228.1 sugar ABC transporter permease [Candidatus Neomarinimicrobiota bacterium]RKY53437.1 MAG: sugar ABC transporter permease [Candidatus Neomarinimicrobiota bacterium]
MGAIFLFFFIPVVASLFMSFTDFDIYSLGDISKVRFVGFKNYIELFKHPLFWKALGNTAYFVFIGGPLSIFVSLMAALLINSKMLKFKSFFRLAYFLPVVTTLVAIAIVWRYVYHPEFGLMNYFLRIFGIKPVDWLGDPRFAMPAIILMAVWKNFGYNMIIFTAGLQNIPGELYEASWIDGANKWKQFIHVTLPLLSPTTLFVSITTMIGYFQLFAEPYVMTQGGPLNSTLSIVLLMYNEGFKWWKMGYSASIAFTLFFIVLIITLIQLKLQKGIKID